MMDKPIIFSAPMVRALLDGRKTQTRRVLKPQLGSKIASAFEVFPGKWRFFDENGYRAHQVLSLPYAPGDRLWVREAFIGARGYDAIPPSQWGNKPVWYAADGEPDREKWWHLSDRKRPSIHMPRWASRLTLTVTDVLVQRLQEISEEDAVAEGTESAHGLHDIFCNGAPAHLDGYPGCDCETRTPRDTFSILWNSIHGPDAWAANPWVAAISFTVQRGNIDQMGNG